MHRYRRARDWQAFHSSKIAFNQFTFGRRDFFWPALGFRLRSRVRGSLGNIDSISREASLYTIQHYIHIVQRKPVVVIHDKPFNLIITKKINFLLVKNVSELIYSIAFKNASPTVYIIQIFPVETASKV